MTGATHKHAQRRCRRSHCALKTGASGQNVNISGYLLIPHKRCHYLINLNTDDCVFLVFAPFVVISALRWWGGKNDGTLPNIYLDFDTSANIDMNAWIYTTCTWIFWAENHGNKLPTTHFEGGLDMQRCTVRQPAFMYSSLLNMTTGRD